MARTSSDDGNIVFNAAEKGDTLEDILEFIANNIGKWKDKQVLWDVTLLDLSGLNASKLRSIIGRGAKYAEVRSGKKTAILAETKPSFGMMRMFESLYPPKSVIEIMVFIDKNEAVEWLEN